jgi:ATP-dependent DNA ligase
VPADLTGPVEVELARPVEQIPGTKALSGGTVWEPKLDGYRGVIVRGTRTRIWSRNRRDLTDRFPDIVRAAEQQPPGGAAVDGVI